MFQAILQVLSAIQKEAQMEEATALPQATQGSVWDQSTELGQDTGTG